MLHAAMIYGGNQENISKAAGGQSDASCMPAPGGGRQIVQPIYIDDIVDCLFVAAHNKMGREACGLLWLESLSRARDGKTCAKSIGS